METVNSLKVAISTACAVLTALWGWLGWLVVGWIVCMVLDYVTGTAAALRTGTWSSKLARDGLWHKAGCIASVMISAVLDLALGQLVDQAGAALPFDYSVFLCPAVIVWYMLTEAGSIVENAGRMGAPIPKWLAKAIASLKDQADEEDDQNGKVS